MAYLYSLHPVTLLSLSATPSALVEQLRHFIGDCPPNSRRGQEIDHIVTGICSQCEAPFTDAEYLTPAEARVCYNAAVGLLTGVGVSLVDVNSGKCFALVDPDPLHWVGSYD